MVSNHISGSKISYFNKYLCPKPKIITYINDSTPPKELVKVSRCIDSLVDIDRKTESTSIRYSLKRTLDNYNKDSDFKIYFSLPENTIITVVVCQVRGGLLRYDCANSGSAKKR